MIPIPAYFGTYTTGTQKGEGIYLSYFLPEEGTFTAPALVAKESNPSFLTISPDKLYLYAVNEIEGYKGTNNAPCEDEPPGYITAFKIDPETGSLTYINKAPTLGGSPCHLTVD